MKFNFLKRIYQLLIFISILLLLINCRKENFRPDAVELITPVEISNTRKIVSSSLIEKEGFYFNKNLRDKPLIKFASLLDTNYIGVLAPIYFKEKPTVKGILSLKFNKKNEIIEETLYSVHNDLSLEQLDNYEYYVELLEKFKYQFPSDIKTSIKNAKIVKRKPNINDTVYTSKAISQANSQKRGIQSSSPRTCVVNFSVQFFWVTHCDQYDEQHAISEMRLDLIMQIGNYLASHIQMIGGQITKVDFNPPYITLGGMTTHPQEHPLGDFSIQPTAEYLLQDWIRKFIIRPFQCLGNGNLNIKVNSFYSQCNDSSAPGTGGGGGGSTHPIPFSNFLNFIIQKPYVLIPNIPCEVVQSWVNTANFVPNSDITNKLDQVLATPHIVPGLNQPIVARIQSINNAYSSVVNMDNFSVRINQLPVVNGARMSPSAFLEYIRLNLNSFVDNSLSKFEPYSYYGIDDNQLWNSSSPFGAIIGIDIPGPDNGSVIVSNSTPTEWTFTTINDPKYHDHPVSGNRDFGYKINSDGSFNFYTRGVDRITNWDATLIQQLAQVPFTQADYLWSSFQSKIANFVNQRQGNATVNPPQKHRPDWSIVKGVLDGTLPLNTLSTDCN